MAGAETASSARTATAMLPMLRDRGHDAVAGVNRAHSLRRAGEDEIPGVKRVHGGRHLDQFGDAQNEVPRVRLLTHFAVDRDLQIERARVRNLVGGHEPRPEHRVGVRRLAEAAILRASNRDVEPDRVAGHVRHRILTRDVVRAFADDDDELDFVIGAPLGKPNHDALARTNERTRGLQEQTRGLDVERAPRIVPVELRDPCVASIAMLLVVDRRRDDLARIGDGAQQRD